MNNLDDKISRLSSFALALLLVASGFLIYTNVSKAEETQDDVPRIEEPDQIVPPSIREEILREQAEQEKSADTYIMPTREFSERITKKSFGTYVTPQNSPVSPERFTGYHTAVDVEFGDVAENVPVYALANGKVVYSNIVDGYGGVFMIEFDYNGSKRNAVYGHIRPNTLPNLGRIVTKGEEMAVLGRGYSVETDNERKHLHFGILSNNRIDLRGYVANQSQLSGWIDPLTLFP